MQLMEIRKQSLNVIESATEGVFSLARQAQEVLGYNLLQKITGNFAVELTTLQAALKEAEIEVLLPGDVLAYQKERQIEQTKANLERWLSEFAGKTKVYRYERFDGPAWVEQKISEYTQPVPEFVLAKAVQIKQAVPECEIYIESLQDHPDPFLVVAIPGPTQYSEAKERYYVEVWAEPKFEGRL